MKQAKFCDDNVAAILCGDLHLRDDQPICRTDDFFAAQAAKVQCIKELQKRYKVPVLCSGDLGNTWKWSPFLLAWALDNLPDGMVVVPGNHDLPQHSLELIHKSGIFVLERAGKITLLSDTENVCKYTHDGITTDFSIKGFPFGCNLENHKYDVAIWHHLVWSGKLPWPGCEDPNSEDVLKEFTSYKLILTGDNHKTIITKLGNRLLVNPGSMSRQTVDQINHVPCVFLWDAEHNAVKSVPLPIQEGVISRAHIEKSEFRDKRISAFIERLSQEADMGLSFEQNLEIFIKENKLRKEIQQIIYKATEKC